MPPSPTADRRALFAYVAPFAVFCLLQVIPGLIKPAQPAGGTPLWLLAPEFWVYPLQTTVCGALLIYCRRGYPWSATPAGLLVGGAVGLFVFALWVSPQALFHLAPRTDGFDPSRLLHGSDRLRSPVAYDATVTMRFVRLALVVPWLEEVFWRGFLLRYLVREDFLELPFGTCSRFSFLVVALAFMCEHRLADWPAAVLTGALYNGVAIWTRSLPACVLAHALTNLLLGGYVMHTQQWGFW